MIDGVNRSSGTNPVLAVLLAIAVVALGVLGYLYYQQQHNLVKIEVPNFSGTVSKDGTSFYGEFKKRNDKGIHVEIGQGK
jgi:hypothetical protein